MHTLPASESAFEGHATQSVNASLPEGELVPAGQDVHEEEAAAE
jgi:hypothetical protein